MAWLPPPARPPRRRRQPGRPGQHRPGRRPRVPPRTWLRKQAGHPLDPTDKTTHGELISWLDRQRCLDGQGLLDAARVSELDALGTIWSKHAGAWERGYAYAAAFHHQHGHLAIPATKKSDGYAVGAWMRRQRKAAGLTAGQAAKLDVPDEL
ncbi:helicase associated domain-containing protein [Kitasatospora aureofaciens]|uniref:helicase associated domain-containing protein n=1 Tax=Kitasatospora aureofaciens TaxID=1894 RepID=UPI0037C63DB8